MFIVFFFFHNTLVLVAIFLQHRWSIFFEGLDTVFDIFGFGEGSPEVFVRIWDVTFLEGMDIDAEDVPLEEDFVIASEDGDGNCSVFAVGVDDDSMSAGDFVEAVGRMAFDHFLDYFGFLGDPGVELVEFFGRHFIDFGHENLLLLLTDGDRLLETLDFAEVNVIDLGWCIDIFSGVAMEG